MYLPFLGSLEAKSVVANAGGRMNFYPELDKEGKSIAALYGTPGLTRRLTLSTGPVRGMWPVGDYCYVVGGAQLYRFDSSWYATSLGALQGSIGPVRFTDNGTQVLLVDGTYGYVYNTSTGVFAKITDTDFPAAATCAYMDGYGIVEVKDTGRFMITALNDFTNVDSLDFSTADGAPDETIAVLVDHRELVLFGDKSVEVFFNSGNADFPFERIQGAYIEYGLAARYSPSKMNNSIYFLGQGKDGQGLVIRLNGYTPQRISDHKVEQAIAKYSTISDAIGFCQQQDGHSFYWLVFPTANKTWVFDASTEQFHERGYWNAGIGDFIRHRANCYAFFNQKHIVGDFENGKVYSLEPEVYTDDGVVLISLIRDKHVYKGMNRLKHKALQLDFETGVGLVTEQGSDPQAILRWSDDGGRTWSNEHSRSIGAIGAYKTRVRWARLGTSRDRTYELRISDPIKRAIVGADYDVEELLS